MENLSKNALPTERPRPPFINTPLVCLNFKVPMRVRQQFKMYAARHNITMTELLLRLLEECLIADANHDILASSQYKEIKK